MEFVNVSFNYGWVIRRGALVERGVSLEDVLSILEISSPLDSNDQLVSLAPRCAADRPEQVVYALRKLGLEYFDDFVEVFGAFPAWCCFKVGCMM